MHILTLDHIICLLLEYYCVILKLIAVWYKNNFVCVKITNIIPTNDLAEGENVCMTQQLTLANSLYINRTLYEPKALVWVKNRHVLNLEHFKKIAFPFSTICFVSAISMKIALFIF